MRTHRYVAAVGVAAAVMLGGLAGCGGSDTVAPGAGSSAPAGSVASSCEFSGDDKKAIRDVAIAEQEILPALTPLASDQATEDDALSAAKTVGQTVAVIRVSSARASNPSLTEALALYDQGMSGVAEGLLQLAAGNSNGQATIEAGRAMYRDGQSVFRRIIVDCDIERGEFAESTANTAAAPDPSATAVRKDVKVVILNGSRTPGIAGDAASALEAVGYENVGVGDAPDLTRTSVAYYRTGEGAAARRVADDLGFASTAPLETGSGIESAGVTVQPDVDVVVVLVP